jgi:hypothetical protein
VKWLCDHAPVVLFSAAIPLQGGDHHVNEAWQSHWAECFALHGFEVYDVIRPQIWDNDRIPFWYRQNLLLMAEATLGRELGFVPASPRFLDFVHPQLFAAAASRVQQLEGRRISERFRALRRALGL